MAQHDTGYMGDDSESRDSLAAMRESCEDLGDALRDMDCSASQHAPESPDSTVPGVPHHGGDYDM